MWLLVVLYPMWVRPDTMTGPYLLTNKEPAMRRSANIGIISPWSDQHKCGAIRPIRGNFFRCGYGRKLNFMAESVKSLKTTFEFFGYDTAAAAEGNVCVNKVLHYYESSFCPPNWITLKLFIHGSSSRRALLWPMTVRYKNVARSPWPTHTKEWFLYGPT